MGKKKSVQAETVAVADSAPERWRNRIVGHDLLPPEKLLANPRNWRLHPDSQRKALTSVLGKVGWVQDVVVNRRTGFIVDGHARVELARESGEKVPVTYVDLTAQEEALVLSTFDRISAMADIDPEKLDSLIEDALDGFPGLDTLMDDIAAAMDGVDLDADIEPVSGTGPAADGPKMPKSAGAPVIQYNIIFETEDQQRAWHTHLSALKALQPEMTIAERIVWHLEQNPAKA
jgi:hypothetical protein